jgi:hypothetical protein
MFWGSFSYDFKGPYYIWRTQIVAQRKKDNTEIAELNATLEATAKAE